MNYKAYLIVICDKTTNAVIEAAIWSSPEWQQSRCLEHRTYVAFASGGEDFPTATGNILRYIERPESRYHWLLEHLNRHSKLQKLES